MFLHKIPTVRSPIHARFAVAIFLAFFFYYFTRPEQGDKESSSTQKTPNA